MSGNKKSPCFGLFVFLLFGAQLSFGQEGQSIVGDVLQQRIDQLQDSLFLSEERLDAADLMFIQSARRADSLLTVITSLIDSLAQSRVLFDRVVATNQQNLSRLSALSDSLIQRYYRERELLARNDSLGALLRQTDEFLKQASAVEGNQADSLQTFQLSMTRLQREIAANQILLDQMTSDLQVAKLTSDGIFIDSTADGNYYHYLQEMLAYEVASRGFARLFSRSITDPAVSSFKVKEFQNYFDISGMRGESSNILNLLAANYLATDNRLLASLVYLKNVFIFGDSPAADIARDALTGLITETDEVGQLYYNIALNPDSMNVGNDLFYRYLNYIDRIRVLQQTEARMWFIAEANDFLTRYPGIFQTPQVLIWIGEAYHGLGQYHNEILIYNKVRTRFPETIYFADVLLGLAKVNTNNLDLNEVGVAFYADFVARYSDDPRASMALISEADIYMEVIRDYQKAGQLYRDLADNYPDDPLAPIALFKYAALLGNRMASPAGALAVYQEILNKYNDDPATGIPALEELAILSKRMRQFDGAVAYYLQIFERYPEEEERVVGAILNAADIQLSEMKNIDAAIHTLHLVLDNYPNYPNLKAVQRQVQKLQKRRG